ncbi:hypothetical protein [Streptomyces sp. SP18CS02]|uniref:hypothetical protein n=1 Tax=Streptomyces sp. SP18CS02 TaxID=3002531 RepID=UPI002E77AC5D|nr:hypothetical protein [Streptomyces sp. SP18CS02]MEE1755797.1 hypothetical protein [Streptomyces sp. SP18CS02]
MLHKALVVTAILFLAFLRGPGTAVALPAEVILVSNDVVAARSENGTTTFSVVLLNLTDEPINVTIEPPASAAGCGTVGGPPNILKGLRQQSFQIGMRGCRAADAQDTFMVKVKAGSAAFDVTVVTASVAAQPPPQSGVQPQWDLLWAFFWAPFAALLPVVYAFARWEGGSQLDWRTELRYIKDGWSFKDSWASNVTVVAAGFSGVFGATGVLNALGDSGGAVLSLVTVAGAISLGLTGAAPLLVQFTRRNGFVTPLGLGLGALVTLSATGGQLAVIVGGARSLDLGGFEDRGLTLLGVAGAVLLLGYAGQSLRQNLVIGATDPSVLASPAAMRRLSADLERAAGAIEEDARKRGKAAPEPGAEPLPEYLRHLGAAAGGDPRPSALL